MDDDSESVREEIVNEPDSAAATQPEAEDNEPIPPAMRQVIQAPVISTLDRPQEGDEILIQAQPSAAGDQCVFMVNRPLMRAFSWYFANFESAAGSPLVESLFSIDDVETVLVIESNLTISRKDKNNFDWLPLAKEVGAAIRSAIGENGDHLISEEIVNNIPSEEVIREGIQKVLDTEVNPGVAGHGGQISLLGIRGNTVTIQMGGGCQGCSAADLTLKQGIHTSFRTAVPQVGAILDETDHAAGLNPYFS